MSAVLVAVALSLVSAVAYATAAVAQERLASRSPGTGALRLLGSGAWWWTVVLNAAGALLHVVALAYGPLTVVQPLGALTLVTAVPMGAWVAGRRVGRMEWRGTVFTLAGLAAILVTASGPAPDDTLSMAEALLVAAATAALIGVLARPGARPGLRHATASGIASGVASALTQTVTVAVTDRSGPLLDVRVIGVVLLVAVFAAGGLLLSQTAYRSGLGAPLAMVTLTNPVAAAVIGLCLLGERFRGGPTGVLLALTGAALASWGVLLLTRATSRTGRQEHAAPGPAGRAAARRSAVEHPAGPSPVPSADLLAGPLVTDRPVAAVLTPQPGSAAPELVPVPRPPAPRTGAPHDAVVAGRRSVASAGPLSPEAR
ncbi:DMT family transporter [Streptomyces sp. NPDC005774]|uniref:DMT family transporter n=1 Tax=Streptomyces sp. NPDC005774 TaxID=3364728 RepID=UPI00368DA376